MKKRMKPIARQLVGSRVAHQTAEAATQQRQSGRVLNMGSAGDSPAPVGDSPTGTAPSHVANRPFSLPRTVVSVPSGGSPVLPETIFQSRSQAKCRGLSPVAEWMEQIQTLWGNGAESRLELASLISTIRNHLRQRRGDWSSLWESGELPFSKRKAEKLVVVGDGLGWAINANACSHLPTEWNALYYIARLRRSVQERLIQERVIRQTLSVSQARDLFARFHGVTLKNRSRKTRFRERLRRFEDFFLAELPNCSQAEKNLARARLTGLIQLIDEDVPLPNGGPIFPVSITHIRIEQNANDKNNSSPSLDR